MIAGRLLLAAMLAASALKGQAKRIVVVKVDGLPADRIEKLLQLTDPATGGSVLPWMRYIFLERGAWVQNFYVRGISLSAPSWSMLDTGQHLTIRGNAEFDRLTPRVYDYLNFFPYYVGFARLQRADMPGVEVLDQFGVPLLLDQFTPEERRQSMQLFQRGVRWTTLKESLVNRVSRPAKVLINEWETGFEIAPGIDAEEEKELVTALADPRVRYLDLYLGDYDHGAHLTNDDPSQLRVIKRLDARLGRVWTAIQASSLAQQTVLALVSDHGMNSTPAVYSQGYNLVKLFNNAAGGGHHVVTVRHPMTEFKLKGLDPFVTWVVTPSAESTYLRGQEDYPTALLDPDGNERAAVQLRNSDLNAIHILLLQLKRSELKGPQRSAARDAVLSIIEANRARWTRTAQEMEEELTALGKAIEVQKKIVATDPRKWPLPPQPSLRDRVTLVTWQTDEHGYREYVRALRQLLALKEPLLEASRIHVEQLVPKGVMGEENTLGQLRNYVAGLGTSGIVVNAEGTLDREKTFRRVNYFSVLSQVRVRNVVQRELGVNPIDFVAMRVRGGDSIAVLAYGDERHQALLQSKKQEGTLYLRYVPVSELTQDAEGIHFTEAAWNDGFPLHLFEDSNLRVQGDRAAWLSAWHTEREWLDAIHRTRYSNGVIGLEEMFQRWQPELVPKIFQVADQGDWPVLRRFAGRKREVTEADFSIFASDHWNFNVRGFNPGGNHGSFLRISTHSVLMAAGAGIPAGLIVERPYDGLSFVPTLLSLMGKPVNDYPGAVIEELLRH